MLERKKKKEIARERLRRHERDGIQEIKPMEARIYWHRADDTQLR